MMKKLMLFVMLIFVAFLAIPALATDVLKIEKVEVNDIEPGTDAVYVERGEKVEINVLVRGDSTADIDDIRVKAWLGGYEYGDVEDTSNLFSFDSPGVKNKKLSLEIPNDIDPNDDYTLHVEVYNKIYSDEQTFTLRIQEQRHSLRIQDVILRPSSTLEAGSPLFVVVRVENLGDKKEEDVRIDVTIPELGISARDYIDELITQADEDKDNEDEESSMSSNELYLKIPDDASEGIYFMTVDVIYARGHEHISTKEMVYVTGREKEVEVKQNIAFDALSQEVNAGDTVEYKVMVTNLGNEDVTYTTEVVGEKLFAVSAVSPSLLTVGSGETKEVSIKLNTKEEASSGMHEFKVSVKSDGEVLREETLYLNVFEKEEKTSTRDALVIAFIVLIVILIILGIIIAFTRLKKGEAEELEGETYY